ncbi:Uncharacterised protein [Shigella sonnei]|nr:Uncharacterised protein [Shigella sonnei]
MQLIRTQIVKNFAYPKTQKRFVLQRLYGPFGNLLEKLFGRLFGEGEFQQTRGLRRRDESESAIVLA